ncbi:hypothetical protein O181_026501 [Austropuccinia psidii MF-1]|uniref:Zn(2)-C6 fungal-type domain-containing protein n=1 Tax=Austropuccinia psidii MF-1 TaxID=1389203 RepID=A0A9Q3CQK2_9BASI|nr:hypothetical protein [Austropuccinia psidii MF-1]
MLEGSFRPPSVAAHHYAHSKSAYVDQSLVTSGMRRKEPSNATGSSFVPLHDRSVTAHSSEYDPEDHPQTGSPPPGGHHAHFFPQPRQPQSSGHPSNSHSQSNSTSLFPPSEISLPLPPPKSDSKPTQEPPAKNPSFGPVRAKKKPAGSACNSCHRLKTRCSGGYPCDRCAAHKVPCQFDRDLIYRSPLASSSQQAFARNAQAMNNGESKTVSKSRSRAGGPKASKRAAAAAATTTTTTTVAHQPLPVPTPPPATVLEPVKKSPALLPPPHPAVIPQNPLPATTRKQGAKLTPVSTPAPSEAFVGHDTHSPPQNGLHLRLSALENSVSGLLQALRTQQLAAANSNGLCPDIRPPASPPAPPSLVFSGSSASFGPERDVSSDENRLGSPSIIPGMGDPLMEGILSCPQAQCLFDVFVEFCLPSIPILHRVQLALIRARSAFLFSTMLAIGARFCSSQSTSRTSPTNANNSNQTVPSHDTEFSSVVDDSTYVRLVALAYRHLSATLLKPMHTLEDVQAILFLSCWALVSNEDPSGAPNRWVLIGHASRISRYIGLERCAQDLRAAGTDAIWSNQALHEARREQLDAAKTDQAIKAYETILSSSLRLEHSRAGFFSNWASSERDFNLSLVKLANASPYQYDVVSAAQVDALTELAALWASANSFLLTADDRNRALSGEPHMDFGQRHNQALDAWAQKWTWHGSSWAPLLGANMRTIKLLSESLRISVNLALTNILYTMAGTAGFVPTVRFQETLGMALERVNGSSTAVIQAHRDSAREGFSLAWAPDLVTDGLVSAAITVLQLASPFGISPIVGKSVMGAQGTGMNNNDKADVEMCDLSVTNGSRFEDHASHHRGRTSKATRQTATTCSSPNANSRTLSTSCSPQVPVSLFYIPSSASQSTPEGISKKALMEPAVAAHYIRMATDVLQASDRSQTRLGTTMATKIMKLANQAGLIRPQVGSGPATTNGLIASAGKITTPSTLTVTQPRSSVSSASSCSSTKLNKTSNSIILKRDPQTSKDEMENSMPASMTPVRTMEVFPTQLQQDAEDDDEDDDDCMSGSIQRTRGSTFDPKGVEDEDDEDIEEDIEDDEEEEEEDSDEQIAKVNRTINRLAGCQVDVGFRKTMMEQDH